MALVQLVRVVSPSQREASLRLVEEYLRWVAGVARTRYGLDFDVDAMLADDGAERANASASTRSYLVMVDDLVAGVGGLAPQSLGVGELKRMYIRPVARGVGAGRALLVRLMSDAVD